MSEEDPDNPETEDWGRRRGWGLCGCAAVCCAADTSLLHCSGAAATVLVLVLVLLLVLLLR
jgi:hypothetical protein